MEREAFQIGAWKSFEELEDSISVHELSQILRGIREREEKEQRFLAAINGIDLDDAQQDQGGSSFEDVKARAEARLKGESEVEKDEREFAELGLVATNGGWSS